METIQVDQHTIDGHKIAATIEHDEYGVSAIGGSVALDKDGGVLGPVRTFSVRMDHGNGDSRPWALHVNPVTGDVKLYDYHPEPVAGYEVVHQATVHVKTSEDLSNG